MATGTRHRESETALGVCISLFAALLLFAAMAVAVEDAARSGSSSAPLALPPLLGASGEALRARFGEALRRVEVVVDDTVYEQVLEESRLGAPATAAPAKPAFGDQTRWSRAADGAVAREEYDLAGDRVYRVRWQLVERYEHPLLNDVVARAAKRFGPPGYDQTLRAKPGSARADLRRVGWNLDGRALEVRQLHPFTGGPIFLTIADRAALQAIVDRRETPLPQPDTTGAWWRRAQRPPSLLTKAERRIRVDEIGALLDRIASGAAKNDGLASSQRAISASRLPQ
jgi:hypothetical protein